jgi:hypothetical protein
MFLSIVKWGLISLTIIYLIHHLYMFFLNTLTVPKIKDLVNKPSEQYDEMFKMLQGNGLRTAKNETTPKDDTIMTEELSSFLNELKKKPEHTTMPMTPTNVTSNTIMGLNEFDSYSAF